MIGCVLLPIGKAAVVPTRPINPPVDITGTGSEADLRAGRKFQIIELNGAASEDTSIYDARNSLRSAYGALFRQWELVFAIGAANRRRGAAPASLALLWHKWRETTALAASYPLAD